MSGRSRRPEARREPSSNKRDVSPLGASKFEKPYTPTSAKASPATTSPTREIPPVQHFTEPTPRTSTTTSHTSPSIPPQPENLHSKPSLVPTYSTAPTTYSDDNDSIVASSEIRFAQALDAISNSDYCPLPEDRDAWFQRHTEDSLDLPVEEGDECPDGATLAAVQDIPLYDADGNSRPFGSLYDPATAPHQRQLIIFIRHIYCGACQAFVKALTEGISMEDYFHIPTPTSIILISCGKPDLIPTYYKFTTSLTTNKTPHFPVFVEPTRKLFKMLGMKWKIDLGRRPEYMRNVSIADCLKGNVRDIGKEWRDPEAQLRKRDIVRGGNMLQIGGEFLFENGEVVWCHRMRSLRGHAEVAVLRKLLELDPTDSESQR